MPLSASRVQLPLLTASLHCPGVVFVRGRCSRLAVSRLTLPQSTFVCPSLVDAPHFPSNVLSCGWWSVDEDVAVSVQCTATASDVTPVRWCCSCLDVSNSSLPQSTSVCPSVVDGRSSVPSTCTPDDSCTLLVEYVSPLLPEHTDLSVMLTLR